MWAVNIFAKELVAIDITPGSGTYGNILSTTDIEVTETSCDITAEVWPFAMKVDKDTDEIYIGQTCSLAVADPGTPTVSYVYKIDPTNLGA